MNSLLLALLFTGTVFSQEASELDKRVMHVASELRCLVCQNQTIADSSADLAVDLRRQIREALAKGASEREVLDFMVQRYGDFVLYRPPLKASTLLLGSGPFLLLALGLWLLARRLRAAARPAAAPLSAEERARAAALLDAGKE